LRTGREALLAVDCFGNIRIVHLADAPKPDDLYTYEAPLVPRWVRPALGSDLPDSLPVQGGSPLIRSLYGVYTVFYMVRERVRGPPNGARHHPSTSLRMSPALAAPRSAHAERSRSIRARAKQNPPPHRTVPAAPATRAA